jgi:hypothetical protein
VEGNVMAVVLGGGGRMREGRVVACK